MTATIRPGSAWQPDEPAGERMPSGTPLRVAQAWEHSQVVLTLAGDIDLTTAPVLREAAAQCLRHRPARLLLDLASVEYCDCAGVRALSWAAGRAAASGCGFGITGAGSAVRRILALIGTPDLLAAVDDP